MNLGNNFFNKMSGRLVPEGEGLQGLVSIPQFCGESSYFPKLFKELMGLEEHLVLEVLTNKEQTKIYTLITTTEGRVVVREYGFVELFFGFIAFLDSYGNG